MDEEEQQQRDMFAALDRLVSAKWARSWSLAGGWYRVEWIDDGAEKLRDLVELLEDLSQGEILRGREQTALGNLYASLKNTDG